VWAAALASLRCPRCGYRISSDKQTLDPTLPPGPVTCLARTELGELPNPYDQVSGYNNFYEFTGSKEDVQYMADDFTTSPWQTLK
jgi:hypothetical protein